MLSLLKTTVRPLRLILPATTSRAHVRHFELEALPALPALPELPAFDSQSQSEAAAGTGDSAESEEIHPDDKPLRPPHGVKIDENHGLFAFFRIFQQPSGDWERQSLEPKDVNNDKARSCRSWTAPELRRKSFKDLHTLWYVILRERNLLATQKAELMRLGVESLGLRTDIPWRDHQCRKSMARIKAIINERRVAYEGAVEQFVQDKALRKVAAAARKEPGQGKKMPQPTTKGRTTVARRQARKKSRNAGIPVAAFTPTASPLTA